MHLVQQLQRRSQPVNPPGRTIEKEDLSASVWEDLRERKAEVCELGCREADAFRGLEVTARDLPGAFEKVPNGCRTRERIGTRQEWP